MIITCVLQFSVSVSIVAAIVIIVVIHKTKLLALSHQPLIEMGMVWLIMSIGKFQKPYNIVFVLCSHFYKNAFSKYNNQQQCGRVIYSYCHDWATAAAAYDVD